MSLERPTGRRKCPGSQPLCRDPLRGNRHDFLKLEPINAPATELSLHRSRMFGHGTPRPSRLKSRVEGLQRQQDGARFPGRTCSLEPSSPPGAGLRRHKPVYETGPKADGATNSVGFVGLGAPTAHTTASRISPLGSFIGRGSRCLRVLHRPESPFTFSSRLLRTIASRVA